MHHAILVLLASVLLISPPAAADRVEPNERVETRLLVRETPGGATISAIAVGQSAELLSSVPYWYQVRTDTGAVGFVSKGWSRVVPDLATSESVLRIGSWNIKKLGHGSQKDYALVARVIEEHFDVAAVVEVMQKGGEHPGYDQLLAALGSGWRGEVTETPRPNTTSGSAEFYAVLYRAAEVEPCAGWTDLRFTSASDGTPSGVDAFSREPAFGCLRSKDTGFDFILAAYHARWAEGDIEEIQGEVRHLGKVFAAMAASDPGEKDLIISGDFNLIPADLDDVIHIEVPTSGSGSTLNGQGDRTGNLYDHMVVHDASATSELIGSAEVLDVREVAASPRAFFKTVSDHLPIVARFRSTGDDD